MMVVNIYMQNKKKNGDTKEKVPQPQTTKPYDS